MRGAVHKLQTAVRALLDKPDRTPAELKKRTHRNVPRIVKWEVWMEGTKMEGTKLKGTLKTAVQKGLKQPDSTVNPHCSGEI